jgi:amino acid permease
LMAVVYLLFVVLLYYFNPSPAMPAKPSWDDLEFFKFDTNFVSHFPIFVFAYTCHQNVYSLLT